MSGQRATGAVRLTEQQVVAGVRRAKLPLDRPERWAPLLERIGDARVVLLGEASHGTHEFYALRAELTRRLIVEEGFSFVAVEADWPDTYRVNRWVQHVSDLQTRVDGGCAPLDAHCPARERSPGTPATHADAPVALTPRAWRLLRGGSDEEAPRPLVPRPGERPAVRGGACVLTSPVGPLRSSRSARRGGPDDELVPDHAPEDDLLPGGARAAGRALDLGL